MLSFQKKNINNNSRLQFLVKIIHIFLQKSCQTTRENQRAKRGTGKRELENGGNIETIPFRTGNREG